MNGGIHQPAAMGDNQWSVISAVHRRQIAGNYLASGPACNLGQMLANAI